MAFSSISEIANRVHVAQATIVRLAQSIGYRGYLELKTEILEHLRQNLAPVERFRTEINHQSEKDDILNAIAGAEVKNINKTLRLVDRSAFEKAVDFIIESHHVYTMGLGISAFVSQTAAYLLNRITLKTSALSHGSVSFIEQIIPMQENDAIIAFCFPPYSSGTIEAARFAKSKKIKFISLTDKMTAPIVEYSDITLQTKTENNIFANSLSAIHVIIYSLATATTLRNKESSRLALTELAGARSEYAAIVDSDYIQANKKFY